MRRLALPCSLLLAAALFLAGCSRRLETEPLTAATDAPAACPALPAGSVVVNATNGVVTAPFAVGLDGTTPLGVALALAEGAGSRGLTGSATFTVTAPTQQTSTVWIHARWHNSCGNSLSLTLDEGKPVSVGQDAVYGTWHWVKAGRFALAAGAHKLALLEREDGIAVDQLLLAADEAFAPTGCVIGERASLGIRRFADVFDRSPGHGLGGWDVQSGNWQIAFTLDPNRIPHQYALTGAPASNATGSAEVLVQGAPWQGCRLSFSALTTGPGVIGAVLDRVPGGAEPLRLAFAAKPDGGQFAWTGYGRRGVLPLGDRMRTNQWHRIEIERWAWVLRVALDGASLLTVTDLPLAAGAIGLCAEGGEAVFDDVSAEDLPWQTENGRDRRMAWQPAADAAWSRVVDARSDLGLLGERGVLRSAEIGLPVAGLLFDAPGVPLPAGFVPVAGTVVTGAQAAAAALILAPGGEASTAPMSVALAVSARAAVGVRRLAVRYGSVVDDAFGVGSYHFTRAVADDPSDYLDFTEAEYAAIANAPDEDKLKRGVKMRRLLGWDDTSFWVQQRGSWQLRNGVLQGVGPQAVVKHWRDVNGCLDLSLRIRLASSNAVAAVALYADPGTGAVVRLCAAAAPAGLAVPPDAGWHTVSLRARDGVVAGRVDAASWREVARVPTVAGGILLRVAVGGAEFDEIEISAPRDMPRTHYYAFDRRETDWWCEGATWSDHAGISCVLASNWISLMAPGGAGTLWNKRRFGSDIVLALNVEESSEWFGWHKNPTHVHHPYDNVQLRLAVEGRPDEGYLLEVNARKRTATVLYRNGQEVAVTPQDKAFPIRYVGGHAQYEPRRNRVTLAKTGGSLRAIVNGREVLTYTDPQPLPVARVGIGGRDTHVNFSAIEIVELTP